MKISQGIPWFGLVIAVWLQISESKVYEDWGKPSATVGFIVGGDIVDKPGIYPWHVAIFNSGKYLGGGSLISEQFVLTVTHVTYDVAKNQINPKSLTVKAGIVKLSSSNANIYNVAEIIRYPGYVTETFLNDICLLKLEEKVTFGRYVGPIFLWNDSDKVLSKLASNKHEGKVIGFGFSAGSNPIEDLRKGSVTPVTSEDCIKNFKGFKEALSKDRNFCANGRSSIVCSGDSGSGLIHFVGERNAYYLRGLVSQGHPECTVGTEAVFTDVVFYLKWIEKNALPTMYNLLGNPTCAGVSKNENSQVSLPGLVNLKYVFRKSFFISDCHGVLITKKHVLAQANCVATNSVRKLHAVAVGSSAINDYSKQAQQYTVKTISVDKELAIITLSDEVKAPIDPVCIPTRPEDGKLNVLFWERKTNHPKYVHQLNVLDQNKQMGSKQEMLSVKIIDDADNLRLGGTPLLYNINDETGDHLYLRALEKCSIQGCPDGQSSTFVDVLQYRKWIKQIAGEYIDNNILTPPLEDE